jgi:hypothetical protein
MDLPEAHRTAVIAAAVTGQIGVRHHNNLPDFPA